MRYLLDTHAFMWADSDPSRLSAKVATAISDPENTIFVSLVSIWEIQIKHQLGKLPLAIPLNEIIERQQNENALKLLPISLPHILSLAVLPLHHRDPFDRLLIAQARFEGLTLISHDSIMTQYAVHVLW
jgi:PIN domain nuclease of toxin-antitoxin system